MLKLVAPEAAGLVPLVFDSWVGEARSKRVRRTRLIKAQGGLSLRKGSPFCMQGRISEYVL